MRTAPRVQRCAPGGRVRGQCCTALMDTRRGPCRPLASSSAPTGSTAHLRAGWFRLGAQPTDLLEFLPAGGVTIQTCSCMQRTRLSLSHFAHYWTCRASQLGAQATGAPLSLPTRTSEFRGCGSVGPPRLAEGRRQQPIPSCSRTSRTFQKTQDSIHFLSSASRVSNQLHNT